MDQSSKVGVDAKKIRTADAVTLMLHHLSLAATYFEATPATTVEALAAIPDVFEGDEIATGCARLWYLTMVSRYEALDQPDAG